MPFVNVNSCNFYYELTGEGPDIVFIHGELHGIEYWEYQLAEFSKHYRCLTYYRRAHGKSESPEYGYSLVNQTKDLKMLLDHFNIEKPIIIAVAFGSTIAANFAISFPDRVRGLVIVAWSEIFEAENYVERWKKHNSRSAEILERQGRDVFIEYLRKEGGKTVHPVIPVDSPIRDKCAKMFGNHSVMEYKRCMLEFGSSVPNLLPDFRKVRIPVLGICGKNDPYPDKPELLDGMSDFKQEWILGAGRFVHWEKPTEFNQTALRFFGHF